MENEQNFGDNVRKFLVDAIVSGSEFYTSTITDAEFLVRPYQKGDFGAIEGYGAFLKNFYLEETVDFTFHYLEETADFVLYYLEENAVLIYNLVKGI